MIKAGWTHKMTDWQTFLLFKNVKVPVDYHVPTQNEIIMKYLQSWDWTRLPRQYDKLGRYILNE